MMSLMLIFGLLGILSVRLSDCKANFQFTMGIATEAPKFYGDSGYDFRSNDKSSEEFDDDDVDLEDLLLQKSIKRLIKKERSKRLKRYLRKRSMRLPTNGGDQSKIAPKSGGDDSFNVFGIEVQRPIPDKPIIDMPFVTEPMNKLTDKLGMGNPFISFFSFKPTSCWVDATCGPREKCINRVCVPRNPPTVTDKDLTLLPQRQQLSNPPAPTFRLIDHASLRPPQYENYLARNRLRISRDFVARNQPKDNRTIVERKPMLAENKTGKKAKFCLFLCDDDDWDTLTSEFKKIKNRRG